MILCGVGLAPEHFGRSVDAAPAFNQHVEMFSSSGRSRISAIVGIVLIVLYSIVMMANGGDAPWAWLLLVLGLAALFDANRSRISPDE